MRWLFLISTTALLGAGLLLFFNILCGAATTTPLNKWYWLEAGTDSIPGANSVTRWTNYNSCGVSNGRNVDCTSSSAAYPMSPVSNFGTTEGVPEGLHSRKGTTYYLSKTGWAFLLIGLLFTLLTLLPTLVGFCLPSVSALGIASGAFSCGALLFTALSASLLTAGYVMARNDFRDAGHHTSLGRTMLAFIWTSVFLLAVSSVLSGIGCMGSLMRGKKHTRYSENHDSSSHDTYGNDYAGEKAKKKKFGFFRRNQNNVPLEDAEYAGAGVGTGALVGIGAAGIANTTTNKASAGTGTADNNTTGLGAGGDVMTKDASMRGPNGETLEDVAYAAGFGASGATSDYTKGQNMTSGTSTGDYPTSRGMDNGITSSKNNPTTVGDEMKPYDVDTATGYQKAPAGVVTDAATAANDANKGVWAAAAGLLGMGTGAAIASTQSSNRDKNKDNAMTADDTVADHGIGATHAGVNSDKNTVMHANEYENKSTILPMSGERLANAELHDDAIAGSSSKGFDGPMKEGAATSVDDTYTGSHIGSAKRGKDLTDTSGYLTTGYYERRTGNTTGAVGAGVIGGAVGGAVGGSKDKSSNIAATDDHTTKTATSDLTKEDATDGRTGETLDDVAYAAGLGASGATSDYTKNKGILGSDEAPHNRSKSVDHERVGESSGYDKTYQTQTQASGVSSAGFISAPDMTDNRDPVSKTSETTDDPSKASRVKSVTSGTSSHYQDDVVSNDELPGAFSKKNAAATSTTAYTTSAIGEGGATKFGGVSLSSTREALGILKV